MISIVGNAGGADHERHLLRILERLDAGRVPSDANADLIVSAAEIIEFGSIVLGTLVAEQRLKRRGAGERPEYGAVLRGDIVEPIGKPHAAASSHVLRQDGRIAGDVLAHMSSDHARIKIVAPTHAGVDVEFDGFTPIKVRNRLGKCYRR